MVGTENRNKAYYGGWEPAVEEEEFDTFQLTTPFLMKRYPLMC